MKKFIFVFLCFGWLELFGQNTYPGGFNHIIDVRRYSDWGKGYLTITDDHSIWLYEGEQFKVGYSLTFIPKVAGTIFPELLDLIIEVDGISAAGWTEEQFYKAVDNRSDFIRLKIRKKIKEDNKVEIKDVEVSIQARTELPDELKIYGIGFANIRGETEKSKREKKLNKDGVFDMRYDKDFDFFPCRYYDFLITSNNPLLDKSILENMDLPYKMVRNENNPDLLFTIARNADESISTTYVPPTSRTVNLGSKTVSRYNYITERNEYITTQRNRTIREGGYTEETKTVDTYLEIAALDVKKIDDPKVTHPPIVWQATRKRHLVNPNFNDYNKELEAYASWMTLPMDERFASFKGNLAPPVGIIVNNNDKTTIHQVIPYSRAEKAGIKAGDKILKAKLITNNKYRKKIVKKDFKYKGWLILDAYWDETYNIEIVRDGEKMELTLPAGNSIRILRRYYVNAM